MDNFTFYIIPDTHYYEASLGASGRAYENRMKSEQKLFRENGETVRATFRDMAKNKEINTVIIPGDLTQNGEYESHVSLLKDMKELKESGKRILVVTALHDFNDTPKAYIGDELVPVKGTKRTELREMYNEYGYSDAIAIDEISYSYITKLYDGVRLLAINCDGDEKREGYVDSRLKEWLLVQLRESEKAGDKVIAMMHYPLIPQQPLFSIVRNCVLKEWEDFAAFLADNGCHLIFTGHMHAQSCKRFTSENGNSIIDIQTSSAIGYPAKYRTATIKGDKIEIKSHDIPDFTMSDGTVINKKYFKDQFSQMIPNELANMLKEGKPEQTAIQRTLLKIARSLTFGGAARLVGVKASKETRNIKVTDFAIMLVLPMFEGNPTFKPGTPVYEDINKIFKRISPALKKVNEKLSKNGKKVDIKELVMSSLYNQDELDDNEGTISF